MVSESMVVFKEWFAIIIDHSYDAVLHAFHMKIQNAAGRIFSELQIR